MRLPTSGEQSRSPKRASPLIPSHASSSSPVSSSSDIITGQSPPDHHRRRHQRHHQSHSLIMDHDLEVMFTPGSVITCVTCFDQRLEGEVVAFDYERRILVIKSPSSVQSNHHDVHLLNLQFVSDVDIKQDGKKENITITPINVNKVCMPMTC